MRRKLIALYMLLMFIIVVFMPIEAIENSQKLSYYYRKFSYAETSLENAVTAIYLQYRVFDTIFEALLLLISITGIIYFSRHEGDYH